ncbi:hypothetical protein D3C72_1713690 [compost metagenome]
MHRKQGEQQEADPEGGQGGEQVGKAADKAIGPAVEIATGAEPKQDTETAGEQPGTRQQQEGGGKALAYDLAHRRVVEHGVTEIPLQHLGKPVPVTQPERLIQPPAGGDAGVLLGRYMEQIVADIGLDGVNGGVAQQHKGGDRDQTQEPCQSQQGFQSCHHHSGRT